MPSVTIKDLLDAGVHFGHQTKRWDPRMRPYVYGSRNGIHIVDLRKTMALTKEACKFARDITSRGKKILFVSTKKQGRMVAAQEATRAKQYYVTNRWLGGTLTNYETILAAIDRLKKLTQMKENEEMEKEGKKNYFRLEKQRQKLEKNLGGIQEMRKAPGALFVLDPKKEQGAIREAKKLRIPIIGVADTNCDPTGIDYVIPGNDDAIKSIRLFCSLIAESCIEGEQVYQEKLRKKEVPVEKENKEKAIPTSRFEGHIDIASPADEEELKLEEEEKQKQRDAEAALAAAKARGKVTEVKVAEELEQSTKKQEEEEK